MNILLYPIVIPFVIGIAALLIPKAFGRLTELLVLVGALVSAWYAWTIFSIGREMSSSYVWLELENVLLSCDLRVDALSSFILLAISVFTFLIALYSIGFMEGRDRLREYWCYLMWTCGAASLAVLADSLLLLLIGWEITTALLFLMVTMGGKESREAAGKTFVIVGFSDCAMLLGIVLVWSLTGTMRISGLNLVRVDNGMMTLTYILLLTGALVKAGAMPGHTWIPKAAEGAPTSVMAFLPASLDKLLGIYLLARLSLYMFWLTGGLCLLLLVIGAVTVVVAVMLALVQHDLKKLLAFHAVSQVGYMVMGIGTGVPVGIIGGLFHMLNNAVYKCCLFLVAGAVEKRTGTTDLENLGGLAKAMPVTFFACLVSALAISGVPPLNGFVSKWMVYQGTLEVGRPVFLVAAMFGSALTLASFIKVLHSVFLGRRPESIRNVRPVGFAMELPMIVLAITCILFGVFAQVPLRYAIGPAVGEVFESVPARILLPTGMWSPTLATILILAALIIGWAIYLMSTAVRARQTSIFVGGEIFDTESMRFPGTGFYETISRLPLLGTLYRDAGQGVYDLYVLGGRYGSKLVDVLRAAHNGVVSTYLAFAMVGLGFLLFFLVR